MSRRCALQIYILLTYLLTYYLLLLTYYLLTTHGLHVHLYADDTQVYGSCEKQEEWLQYIPAVLYSYRATATVPTHMSPYRILFGREMRTPVDVALMNEWEASPDVELS